MTTARAIEYRIIRRRLGPAQRQSVLRPAERVIAIAAVASLLLVAGSLAPGLVIAGLLSAAVIAII
jgi:hypothetical protein